jgi:hypothetical protein
MVVVVVVVVMVVVMVVVVVVVVMITIIVQWYDCRTLNLGAEKKNMGVRVSNTDTKA